MGNRIKDYSNHSKKPISLTGDSKSMRLSQYQPIFSDINLDQWSIDNLELMTKEDSGKLIYHAFEEGWTMVAHLLKMY